MNKLPTTNRIFPRRNPFPALPALSPPYNPPTPRRAGVDNTKTLRAALSAPQPALIVVAVNLIVFDVHSMKTPLFHWFCESEWFAKDPE